MHIPKANEAPLVVYVDELVIPYGYSFQMLRQD